MISSTEKKSIGERVNRIVGLILFCSLLVGSGFLARGNYRRGRGDRKGAFRLALVMFALEIGLFLCRSHFGSFGESLFLSIIAVSTAMFIAGVMWMLYLAIEPWVRRHWPKTIISWSRLLSGQVRDPLVGRDILFGLLLGVVWALIFQISYIPIGSHGRRRHTLFATEALMGGREGWGQWLHADSLFHGRPVRFFFLAGFESAFGIAASAWDEGSAAQGLDCRHSCSSLSSSHAALAEYALSRGGPVPVQFLVFGMPALLVLRFGLVLAGGRRSSLSTADQRSLHRRPLGLVHGRHQFWHCSAWWGWRAGVSTSHWAENRYGLSRPKISLRRSLISGHGHCVSTTVSQ